MLQALGGGSALYDYAVNGEYSTITPVAFPVIAIVIGILGFVAASKRIWWLVGIVSNAYFV